MISKFSWVNVLGKLRTNMLKFMSYFLGDYGWTGVINYLGYAETQVPLMNFVLR